MSNKKNPQCELDRLAEVVDKYSDVFEKIEIECTSSDRCVRVLFAKKNNSNGKPKIAEIKQEDRIVKITSPCVGFITETFAKVGDVVNKEQVLCVLKEVGVPFNVIASAAGEIVAMFPDDAAAAGFGEVLLSIKVFE